jgi:ubiquinone biosynthesis monooxygenase Coq7
MTPDERTIRRILTVNHAGEHGAVSIYSAQIRRMGRRHPELRAWLEDVLEHEREHRAAFLDSMSSRGAEPCCSMGVWSRGGWSLGWICALFGPPGVMACTAAVERTVHRHMDEQIVFLADRDPALAGLIQGIQRQEFDHLAFAEARIVSKSLISRLLEPVVAACTEAIILLSTRGDSLRLRRALA